MNTFLVETPTHGRALVRASTAARAAGLLVGFHGYAETAEAQMERLAAVPGAEAWTLLSVQALHRFYRSRSQEVVASWMTSQDRIEAIADNVRYIDAAVAAVPPGERRADDAGLVVYAGFSQGVAMAFRAGVLGRPACAGIIAVGGDVPPELTVDPSLRFPSVLLVRGTGDPWYAQTRFEADARILTSRGAAVRSIAFDGGHEWGPAASAAAGSFLSSLQSF